MDNSQRVTSENWSISSIPSKALSDCFQPPKLWALNPQPYSWGAVNNRKTLGHSPPWLLYNHFCHLCCLLAVLPSVCCGHAWIFFLFCPVLLLLLLLSSLWCLARPCSPSLVLEPAPPSLLHQTVFFESDQHYRGFGLKSGAELEAAAKISQF